MMPLLARAAAEKNSTSMRDRIFINTDIASRTPGVKVTVPTTIRAAV
jgi:hypothetical protein